VFWVTFGHKIPYPQFSFYREWSFGYRQDTKQADHAGQKPLSDANCPPVRRGRYNKDTWAKKASFLAFPILLLGVSPFCEVKNFAVAFYRFHQVYDFVEQKT
jgi:hypothetical protein